MHRRLIEKIEVDYNGGKIITKKFEGDSHATYNSFEAQNKNGVTLWLSDIMYACDYIGACKHAIDNQ